jgi:beta-lactamase regulating signal transducer with metallopeptidase domain
METISRFVITFLVNASWQVMVIGAAAACCAFLLRKSPARFCHNLWFAALALCLLVPLMAALDLIPAEWFSSTLHASTVLDLVTGTEILPSADQTYPWPVAPDNGYGRLSSRPVLAILIICYAMFLLYRVVRLCVSLRRATALVRGAQTMELDPSARKHVAHSSAAIGVEVSSVRFSAAVSGPITAGMLKPQIILPFNFFEEQSTEVVVSALSHEMAHVRRRDFLWNLCAEIFLLPIAFHPAVALIKRQLDQSRELASDEMVVRCGVPGSVYARALVHLSSTVAGIRGTGYTLGVLDADILEKRIIRIMDKSRRSNSRLAYFLVFATAAMLGATCLAASALSVRFAAQTGAQSTYSWFSIDGTWQAKWHGDNPAMTLKLAHSGESVSGTVVFYRLTKSGDGFRVDGKTGEIPLIDPKLEGTTLHFKTKYKGKAAEGDDIREFAVTFKDQNTAEMKTLGVSDGLILQLIREK